MRSDADNDTRSPWFDAFAPHANAPAVVARPVVETAERPTEVARPAPAELDSTADDLFDCYNA